MHGWAIAQRLEEVSCDVLTVGQGSLYPALYRLEDTGFLVAEWGQTDAGRRARFYKLTKLGRAQLARERASWDQYIAAVGRVLELA
jgi:transcriptional regulator